MAVFCTLLGHSVFSWGLRYESAAFISTVKLLEPVFAALLGLLLFREVPKIQVVVGGCLVILGVYVYSRFSESGSNDLKIRESRKSILKNSGSDDMER